MSATASLEGHMKCLQNTTLYTNLIVYKYKTYSNNYVIFSLLLL